MSDKYYGNKFEYILLVFFQIGAFSLIFEEGFLKIIGILCTVLFPYYLYAATKQYYEITEECLLRKNDIRFHFCKNIEIKLMDVEIISEDYFVYNFGWAKMYHIIPKVGKRITVPAMLTKNYKKLLRQILQGVPVSTKVDYSIYKLLDMEPRTALLDN